MYAVELSQGHPQYAFYQAISRCTAEALCCNRARPDTRRSAVVRLLTPSMPNRRLASGDAIASRGERNSALPLCKGPGVNDQQL